LTIGGLTYTWRGLETVEGQPTLAEFESILDFFHRIESSCLIFIGDTLNEMEMRYGDGYSQVLDATKYDYNTVANAKSVMGKVPRSNRVKGATFSHYAVVAPLDVTEQKDWLKQAVEGEWSVFELRQKIHKANGLTPLTVVCPECGATLIASRTVKLLKPEKDKP
jgi:hypothetical protein